MILVFAFALGAIDWLAVVPCRTVEFAGAAFGVDVSVLRERSLDGEAIVEMQVNVE